MLLTSGNRKALWWAVEAYLTRWRVEDTIRFIKQSYHLEDVRVLTTIIIDDREGAKGRITGKIAAVEKKLGTKVKN